MDATIPTVGYDAGADAVYVRLLDAPVARTHELDDLRLINLIEDGRVGGIEFLDMSEGMYLEGV